MMRARVRDAWRALTGREQPTHVLRFGSGGEVIGVTLPALKDNRVRALERRSGARAQQILRLLRDRAEGKPPDAR